MIEKQSVLPTITICNINPFKTKFAVDLLNEANLTWTEEEQVDYSIVYLKLQAYLNRTRGYTLTPDEKLALADPYPTVALFILEYQMQTFAWSEYPFETIFHPKYFTCFVFNRFGEESLSNSQDGIFSLPYTGDGIFSRLYYGAYYEQPGLVMFPANIRGVYMFIQNSSDYLYGTDRSPILLTPSHFTKITISRHFYKQYPWPYSECAVLEDNSLVDGYPLHDRFVFDEVIAVINSSSYTRTTCVSFCAQLMIVHSCGCKSNWIAYDAPHANVSYCSMSEELDCAASVWHANDDINGECLPKCPLECSHMTFKVKQNINEWKYSNTFKNNEYFQNTFPWMISGLLDKNTVYLEINYDDLAYVKTLEEPKMSGEKLLAAIGGHLHLFLGMSLLSFVEVIELLVLNIFFKHLATHKSRKELSERAIQFEYLKMDAIPNVALAPNKYLSLFWLALFVCSMVTCVFFIVNTVQQYNMHLVTTVVEQSKEMASDIRFCQSFWMTSDLAVDMLSQLGLLEQNDPQASLNAINAHFKQTRGSYLNNTELSDYGDLDRAVVHCDINGQPCEFLFYNGCYRVLSRDSLGNTTTACFKLL